MQGNMVGPINYALIFAGSFTNPPYATVQAVTWLSPRLCCQCAWLCYVTGYNRRTGVLHCDQRWPWMPANSFKCPYISVKCGCV